MKQKLDIQFIKDIAKDQGHNISDRDAKEAHKIISRRCSNRSADYYYEMKEYFQN